MAKKQTVGKRVVEGAKEVTAEVAVETGVEVVFDLVSAGVEGVASVASSGGSLVVDGAGAVVDGIGAVFGGLAEIDLGGVFDLG